MTEPDVLQGREPFVSEIVAAILAATEKRRKFSGQPTEIQAAFKRVAAEYPRLLGKVNFGRAGGPVNSTAIKSALDGLAMANYLERKNPRFAHYEVTEALDQWYETSLRDRLEAAGVNAGQIEGASAAFFSALEQIQAKGDIRDLLVLG